MRSGAGRLRIAIDGPSGAGKSTLARQLAERLGLDYLDTGAMYRAVAWAALGSELTEASDIVEMLDRLDLRLVTDPRAFQVQVNGVDVTAMLRDPVVGKRASEVAQIPQVRSWLVERQRRIAARGAVLEGRDIGTVVLPEADLKLFVTAAEAVRMQRRAAQIGGNAGRQVERDIRDRDRRDLERVASPLRAASDAVVIDTSDEQPEGSLVRIVEIVETLLASRSD